MAYAGPVSTTPYLNASGATATYGQVVYLSAPGQFSLAISLSLASATVLGIVADASIANGATGNIQTTGTFTTTGLTAGAAYYVSASPGAYSAAPPTDPGQFLALVGVAPTALVLELSPQTPEQISGPGLVMMIGDSNCRGRGETIWADVGVGLENAQPIIYEAEFTSNATDPISWTAVPISALQKYDVDGNNNMGAELSLGMSLSAGGVTCALGKVAIDGTSLAFHWLPSSGYGTSGGGQNLYGQMVAFTKALLAATGMPLKAIIWIDGNDALTLAYASAFAANFATFIAQLRTDLGAGFQMLYSRAPAFGSDVPYVAQLQAQQDVFAATNPSVVMIKTADLLLDTNGDQGGGDQHLTASSLITLGNRFGQAILDVWQPPSLVNDTSAPAYVGMDQVELSLETQTTLTPRWGGALPYVAGDLGILFAVLAGANQPIALTNAEGFTQIGTTQISNGGGTTLCCAVFACVATSASMPAPTVAFGTNETNMAGIMIFRPPSGKTISVDQVAGAVNNAFNMSLALPTVTTTANNELVVQPFAAYAFTNYPTATADNSSLTNLVVVRDAAQKMAGSNVAEFGLITGNKAVAGAVASTAVTTSTAEVLAGFTIALRAS